MASIAVTLLSTLLQKGMPAYRALMKRGFRSEWLRDIELRRMWSVITDHISQYQEFPSRRYVVEALPHFPLISGDLSKENVLALSDWLRSEYAQNKTYDTLEKIIELNGADPEEALRMGLEFFTSMSSLISPVETLDLSDASSIDEAMERYNMCASDLEIGLRYPWPTLHHETLGMHPGELILFYGRPKSMKTFLGLHAAAAAYLQSSARVLIVTRELSKEKMRDRLIASLVGIPYDLWRKGKLSEVEKERTFSYLQSLDSWEEEQCSPSHRHLHPAIRIADGHNKNYKGLDLTAALIDEFRPDLVLDDGIYLAGQSLADAKTGPMDWRVMTAITQRAKAIALQSKIVYLATTQANKSSEKEDVDSLKGFSYSDSFAQDCDVAIRIILHKREGKTPGHILMAFPGFREGLLDVMAINAVPCSNFKEMTLAQMHLAKIDSKTINRISSAHKEPRKE